MAAPRIGNVTAHNMTALGQIRTFGLYLRDISRFPVLNQKQEAALAVRIKAGDIAAKQKLVNSSLRLVVSIAKPYAGFGMQISDLVQEGNIGLIRAAEKFDPDKGTRFSSYAGYWIRLSVWRAIANQGRTIRLPVRIEKEIDRIRKVSRRLLQENGQVPTEKEIARRAYMTEDEVRELIRISQGIISLGSPVNGDATSELGDLVRDPGVVMQDSAAMSAQRRERVERALSLLPERTRTVIRKHFGFDGNEELTLADIGREIGLTRERVRQIKDGGLDLLLGRMENELREVL